MSNYYSERTGEDDERLLTAAAADSAIFYGGPGAARNPLEELLAAEAAAAGESAEARQVRVLGEMLKQLLSFAVEGIGERGVEYRSVEKYVSERAGELVRAAAGGECPLRGWGVVERVVEATGEVLERWEPARVLKRKKARQRRDGWRRSAAVVLWVLEPVGNPGALPQMVGKRVLALAHLTAIPGVAGLSGSKLAQLCGETRQAVSLRERGLDEAMRTATGGRRGARGLRHTVDPRKGTGTGKKAG